VEKNEYLYKNSELGIFAKPLLKRGRLGNCDHHGCENVGLSSNSHLVRIFGLLRNHDSS
jgi:hypothetical protein